MHGSYIWKEFLLESPIPEYTLLGENIIIADNMTHFYNITKYDVRGGKRVVQISGDSIWC